MATIKDVANMAGVAPSTVSKYLNGGTVRGANSEAIRNAIEVLDYRINPFARNLKSPRAHSIGVLLPSIVADFWGQVITSLDRVLRERGYHSIISCYNSDHGLERDKLQFLLNAGIDGLVYVPENLSADEFLDLTSNSQIPTVLVDRAIPGVQTDTIITNNNEITYNAITMLIEKGHKRIGIISGPVSVYTAKERLVGYLRAMSDHNIAYDDSLVRNGENVFATGYHGLLELLKLPVPPTAIFTTNYEITVGVITAAQEHGISIPDGIDIFGYDCADICRTMTPPLPVVQQPDGEIGRLAGEYIIERLDGAKTPPRNTYLDCTLIL